MSSLRPRAGPDAAGQLDRLVAVLVKGHAGFAGLVALLLAVFTVFSLLLPGSFPRASTFQAMMFQLPELALLSLAMVIPMLSGGLNLAIIATANQASLLMAWMLTAQMPPGATGGEMCLWLAAALGSGFLLCSVIGAVTGWLIAVLNVHPILATLGTQTLLGGINIWLSRGKTLSGFPAPLLGISNDTLVGVPVSFIVLMVVACAAHLMLTRTPLGIRIHMVGSNLAATRFSGVETRRVLIRVYVISSLLCWLAAVVMMGRFNSAGADIAQSYLLITVLAAILGGVDPYGGFGHVTGVVVSLAILQTISSGFNLLGVSEHLTLAMWGGTLLLVVLAQRIGAEARSHHRRMADGAGKAAGQSDGAESSGGAP